MNRSNISVFSTDRKIDRGPTHSNDARRKMLAGLLIVRGNLLRKQIVLDEIRLNLEWGWTTVEQALDDMISIGLADLLPDVEVTSGGVQ